MHSDYRAFSGELCYLKPTLECTCARGSRASCHIPVEQQSRAEPMALLSCTRCYKTRRNQRLNMPQRSHERPCDPFRCAASPPRGLIPLSRDVRNVPPASSHGAPLLAAAAAAELINPALKCISSSRCRGWTQCHCRRCMWPAVTAQQNRHRDRHKK